MFLLEENVEESKEEISKKGRNRAIAAAAVAGVAVGAGAGYAISRKKNKVQSE